MVRLVVKGTKFPDEFAVERRLTDLISGGQPDDESLARTLCHIQNSRHKVRLMLLSAQELATQFEDPAASAATGVTPADLTDEQRSTLASYKALIEELTATLKDTTTPVESPNQFDEAAERVRDLTAQLYPRYCSRGDGDVAAQREAAIQELYALHENPDIGEDARLVVYHCRAILDPEWKSGETLKEEEAGVWFCGKLMTGALSDYCGRNEKSKVTVKIAPRTGPAPSGEPRIRYEDQRALYAHMRQRKATYRELEESELRDRVVRQSRGQVVIPGAGSCGSGGAASLDLRPAQLRPIYAQREERILSE